MLVANHDRAARARTPSLAERERAERARSAREALDTSDAWIRSSEKHAARYMAPPRDSPFPLEYMFALLGGVASQAVLDLGCGSGDKSLYLAHRGARVIGTVSTADKARIAREG